MVTILKIQWGEFFMYEKDYDEAKKYYEMVLDIFPFSNSALTSLNEIEKLIKN